MKGFLVFIALIGTVVQASTGLSRYEFIVERAPFGKEPPMAETPVAQPSGTFAKQYRLCMLYRGAEGQLKAGLVGKTNDKSIVLQIGEEEGGLSLVDVRIEEGVAVLRKGNETAQILLEGLDHPASASNPIAVASAASPPAEAQHFVRAGTSGVTDHIRTALIDSAPKRAQLNLTKKIASSGGGAGSSPAARRSSGTSGSSGTGGSAAGSVASAKVEFKSNGYFIQSVPRHIKVEL